MKCVYCGSPAMTKYAPIIYLPKVDAYIYNKEEMVYVCGKYYMEHSQKDFEFMSYVNTGKTPEDRAMKFDEWNKMERSENED